MDGTKLFNISVHGCIEMEPFCVALIDTPQFQRLRDIKQVGTTCYVYPSATHTRFEHSLGVAHLASKFARQLQRQRHDVSDSDVLCVTAAGLCHDLGHGPYSHLFQDFMERCRPDLHWKHEEASGQMLQHMITANNIDIARYGLKQTDILFIRELIIGVRPDQTPQHRPPHLAFLYEIVSNQRNGIDVDKWDYLLRDSYHTGVSISFDYRRLMSSMRVLDVCDSVTGDVRPQICVRDKMCDGVLDMFNTRYVLHKSAYQHRVSAIIDNMLMNAFELADKFLQFETDSGLDLCLTESVIDISAYRHVTDDIRTHILALRNKHPRVTAAKRILTDIRARRFYSIMATVNAVQPGYGDNVFGPEIKKQLKLVLLDVDNSSEAEPTSIPMSNGFDNVHNPSNNHFDDSAMEASTYGPAQNCTCGSALLPRPALTVHSCTFSYTHGAHSPLQRVKFYSKTKPQVAFAIDAKSVNGVVPARFAEEQCLVLCSCSCEQLQPLYKAAVDRACDVLQLPAAV